ncbi:serine protease [Physocladia obscura]|uniref:Serine protease n=1 Tax=Physocladia obscura TaxID=109957 RepID=A0AAD5XIP0_9FUNG|nr:serine protease [Physocladia obscura]
MQLQQLLTLVAIALSSAANTNAQLVVGKIDDNANSWLAAAVSEAEAGLGLAPIVPASLPIAGSYIAVVDDSLADDSAFGTFALSDGASVEVYPLLFSCVSPLSTNYPCLFSVPYLLIPLPPLQPFGFSLESAVLTSSTSSFPRGFFLKNISQRDLDRVRAMKGIKYIEEDQIVYTTLPTLKGTIADTHAQSTFVDEIVQDNPPWGLSRVSHELKPDFDTVDDYVYFKNDGLGVDVYVIDTGININHIEFEGRAVWGATIPEGDKDEDGNGHGTHCAGTISSKAYGVAKRANPIAVKVLRSNGSGSMSDVLKGVEFVARDHLEKNQENVSTSYGRTGNKKSVANMSLGGGKSDALDRAVDGAVSLGVHFAVAAGNNNADACRFSPAASKNSVTVLATTRDDDRAYFSNWGTCIDIGAPGYNILSTWIGSTNATNVISGTSMASPHVAGVIAAYLSRVDSGWDLLEPDALKKKLIDVSVKNVIKGMPKLKGTKNRLLYNSAPAHEHEDHVELKK